MVSEWRGFEDKSKGYAVLPRDESSELGNLATLKPCLYHAYRELAVSVATLEFCNIETLP
jgi:hypothetical protein